MTHERQQAGAHFMQVPPSHEVATEEVVGVEYLFACLADVERGFKVRICHGSDCSKELDTLVPI
jgi:uncharacterized protein YecE (DUF72 family)